MIWGWIVPGWLRRFILWAILGLGALLGLRIAILREAQMKAENEALAARLKTKEIVEGIERDVETQDDTALIDRLTRH